MFVACVYIYTHHIIYPIANKDPINEVSIYGESIQPFYTHHNIIIIHG